MKKLRLSTKELRRLGYNSEQAIRQAKLAVDKFYKHESKKVVLELLENIIQQPERYRKHNHFSSLVESLSPSTVKEKAAVTLKEEPLSYTIFGRNEIDEGSLIQMNQAMRLPITVKGALMADAHQGYGLPIGGVVATENAVIPYGVGMDIGCRMCLSVYPLNTVNMDKDKERLKQILLNETRFGKDEFQHNPEHEIIDRKEFNTIPFLKTLQSKAYKQLGTSGHGNHFVDIGELELIDHKNEWNLPAGKYFAILSHSGSRGMGAEIARHYTRIAKDICQLPKGFRELSWLDLGSEEGQEYWQAMNLAGDYAAANHEIIHQKFSKAIAENYLFKVENHHNFAWKEKLEDGTKVIVHRKGATPTQKGILGIIPGSMATPAYIVRGKGNAESIYSAAHGAGRVLSRKAAKQVITKDKMQQFLSNENITLIGGNTDEAPWVYKDIEKVMEYQKGLVETVARFTPRIVRMAT